MFSRLLFSIMVLMALPLLREGQAAGAPAQPGPDAPELATLGPYAVGVKNVAFVQPKQLDPLQGKDQPAIVDRRLSVRVWYPAQAAGAGITYHTSLPGRDGKEVQFTVPGIATLDAKPAAGRFPLVLLAHGYSNTPEVLSWLGENLASKGYVIVAPAFRDQHERDADYRTDKRGGEYHQWQHLPAEPGTDRRKQLEVAKPHTFLAGGELESPIHTP